MTGARLTRAWIALLTLSAASTLVSVAMSHGSFSRHMALVGGITILVFGWIKARIILSRYLGLSRAPNWLRGFDMVLGFYSLLLLCLYLFAQ